MIQFGDWSERELGGIKRSNAELFINLFSLSRSLDANGHKVMAFLNLKIIAAKGAKAGRCGQRS